MPAKKKATAAQGEEREPEAATPEAPAASPEPKPKKVAKPKPAPKPAPKPTPEPEAAPERRGPWATLYHGVSAIATPVEVTVIREEDVHPQKWFVSAGLCGKKVEALRLEWRHPSTLEIMETYVYDGDGSGTAKFVENGGERGDHLEILA